MDFGVAVRVADFFVVNFRQPVVGGDSAGVAENKTADGVGNGGVFFDAPVVDFEVVVDGVLVVEHRGTDVPQFFVLFSVKDVRLGNFDVTCLNEHDFDGVLNVLDGNDVALELAVEVSGYAQSEHVDDIVVVVLADGSESLFNGNLDFAQIERHDTSVSLFHV